MKVIAKMIAGIIEIIAFLFIFLGIVGIAGTMGKPETIKNGLGFMLSLIFFSAGLIIFYVRLSVYLITKKIEE